MEHGAHWDKGSRGSMGQLGHIGTGVPMCPQCPNVPRCSVLQYNCDRLSPPKTAVLDYIGEITGKSIEICTLYLLRLFH